MSGPGRPSAGTPAFSTRGPILVVGTGLLGTSLALALTAAGIEVHLSDTSPTSLALARDMGAGSVRTGDDAEPRIVVVATPPDVAASVVLRELDRHPGAVVTDVASVKDRVAAEVRARGGDVRRYVGSHPMAGRERSGAAAADSDLFAGRPWVIVGEGSDPAAELVVRNLAVDVGATPVRMTAAEHDAAVAAVSHIPQLLSSLLAARLEPLPEAALALAGRGGRGRSALAAACVVLAAFSRPIGVPLTLALGAWWLWELAGERPPGARGRWRSGLLPAVSGPSGPDRGRQVRLLALTILSGACTLAWPVLAWLSTGRGDAYTATETAWRDGSLTPFAPWLSRSGWWVGPHLGPLLLAGILVVAAAALSAPSLRRLGPGAWFWCTAYVVYLLAFFDPTTSVFRILLPLAPAAWALASCLSTRRRVLLLTACAVGQLFWISWVWDLSVRVTQWVP